MTEQDVLDRALAALGYRHTDDDVEAVRAQTWIAGTFDDDASWLETATPEEIRAAYDRYRSMVYGS